jgi:arginyl-tRNA synthetase
MDIWFYPAQKLTTLLKNTALALGWNTSFQPEIRVADPRFGDLQSNGVLAYAKEQKTNPRVLAAALMDALQQNTEFSQTGIQTSIAGPGFINFVLPPSFLHHWLKTYSSRADLQQGAAQWDANRCILVDFSSPNTAKQMHVGHIRSTLIGDSICRILSFCGATIIRDNHIGDWGTQFGMIIWAIKTSGFDLNNPGDEALAEIEQLYKTGSAAYKESEQTADLIRQELVKLQNGDPENTHIWQRITEISWKAFEHIYKQLDIHFDHTLGESFYRDKVDLIYRELTDLKLATESDGALVVFHPEHKRFAEQPFIVRKADGASNYASTDLATVLYRSEHFKTDEIIYVVDFRQGDHFEQLFLTVEKWFTGMNRALPRLKHVSFGTVLGSDGKAIKTKEGGSIKLRELLAEAIERAGVIVREKNPDLSPEEHTHIAEIVGLGSVKYADLSQNRTSDYLFSWDKMLSFEGNTAPYLLYAVARIHSIFRKADLEPGQGEENASLPELPEEQALARKLMGFVNALEMTRNDLRPHTLCLYLYETAGAFSTFYNACKVMVDEPDVRARRLMLCARTLLIMETGLSLLGLETLSRM